MSQVFRVTLSLVTILAAVGNAETKSLSITERMHVDAKSFTVRDDVEMVRFVDPFQTGMNSPIKYSPDGRYFAIVTERGVLESNRIEDAVWVFSAADVSASLARPAGSPDTPAAPLAKFTAPRAPVICYMKWLNDSRKLAFLAADPGGRHQLYTIDIKDKQIERLSNLNQDVTSFDIQGTHTIYSAVSSAAVGNKPDKLGTVTVGTGLDIGRLVLGRLPDSPLQRLKSLCNLWVIVNGKAVMVEDQGTHQPIYIHQAPNRYGAPEFRISPDGHSIAAALAVDNVPSSWELFPPSNNLPARRIMAGPQVTRAPLLFDLVEQYALIDVRTGKITPLTNAPIGWQDAYYAIYHSIAWSSDSRNVVLANTFNAGDIGPASKMAPSDARPCVEVVNVLTLASTCAMRLPANSSDLVKVGLHRLEDVQFDHGEPRKLIIDAIPERADGGVDLGKIVRLFYKQSEAGTWSEAGSEKAEPVQSSLFVVNVEQTLNAPPKLVARGHNADVSRILLNRNEGMHDVALGDASVFRWEDNQGRRWTGGLVKPPNFTPGVKYPLVLQTHGFESARFLTYGSFPSCMAARELSGAGFIVLQIGGPSNEGQSFGTPAEGPMEVAGFDSAVDHLAQGGMIDRDRVGIIGFSRTVYGVLDALTTGRTHYRAASICDGVQAGYFEYLLAVDSANNETKKEEDVLIGAAPFGKGLETWMQHSPNFNLDKVSAPLMVQAFGTISAFFMWEPYAALQLMGKPVDLQVVNAEDEHVLTNPKAQAASQSLNVDWFRFWLQGYERHNSEDPDQYRRWERLRDLRDADLKATEHRSEAKPN